MHAIGLDLGGTNIKVGLVEQGAGLVAATTLPTNADLGPKAVVDQMAAGVRFVMQGRDGITGIGIGSPGAVSWDRTMVTLPPNFPDWESLHLPNELRARLDGLIGQAPVIVENDANVAGLGSAFYGAGKPFDSFIMVTLGTGVGGAILYQNKLFRGTTGAAGEIGHMVIDYEGPPDRTGIDGVLEAYLGQRFLSRHARYRLFSSDSPLLDLPEAGPDLLNITPRMLYDAAVAGDDHAAEILAWAGHKLGIALGSCVNLLDIRKVVVGGGVSAAGDWILEPARKSLLRTVMPSMRGGVEIVRETLGNEVGMLGAAHLIFEHLDEAR